MLLNEPVPPFPDHNRSSAIGASRTHTGLALAAASVAFATFIAVAVFALCRTTLPRVDSVGLAGVVAERARPLTILARTLTTTGSTFGLLAALIITVGVLRLLANRWLPSIQLAVTMAVSSSLNTLLKIATARPRPPSHLVLGVPSSSYAFPSGHTLNSTVFFLLTAALVSPYLSELGKMALRLGAGVTVVLIGWSRIYLGYHWPTDVLAGWLLGISVVCLSTAVARGFDSSGPELASSPRRPPITTGSAEA